LGKSQSRSQGRLVKSKMSVAIIMGSDSDWPTMKEAAKVLKAFGVSFSKKVISAHRTPLEMLRFAQGARKNWVKVIIAGAGGAAHLPGMVAALTTLPVIGVPVSTKTLAGLDSLLSIAQMPKGVPVATVSIGNAFNAGLLAVQILGIEDKGLEKRLEAYRKQMHKKVLKMSLR